MSEQQSEQASTTESRLEQLLARRARDDRKAASRTAEIQKLKIRAMLESNEDYKKLKTEIRQVKRRLHFARCSVSKKEIAVASRTEKLQKATTELAEQKQVALEAARALADLLDRSRRIEAEVSASVLRAMGLTVGNKLPQTRRNEESNES